MRTKLIAFAAVAGVFLAGSAPAESLHYIRKPLVTKAAGIILSKQPTLVQSVPMPRKPL
jgi:hypothetical protein